MLKFFFACLLIANALLFAFQQGYLESLLPTGREPARIANQLNAEKIKLLAPVAPVIPVAARTPEPEPEVISASRKPEAATCTEIGNFNTAEARRFETQLAALSLPNKLVRREIQEAGSHMVFIPPQDGKAGADKKIEELREFGVTDFYVIQDDSDRRWGISLGVFKAEEAARAHLVALNRKNIRSARIVEYKMPMSKVALQLRGLDAASKVAVEKIKAGFPNQEVRSCE